MSKRYPFTRTISKQNVTVLAFDKETAEPFNMVIQVAPPIVDEAKLERFVEKKVNNDKTRFIEIVDVSIDSKLYGITLEDFLANAVELNPETRKQDE